MKRSLLTAQVVGLAIAASIALGVAAASAAPKTAGHASARSETTTVNVIEAGSADFSSADVLKWIDLMKKNGINVNFNVISDAATALKTVISGQADLFIGSLPDRDPRGRERRGADPHHRRERPGERLHPRRPSRQHASEPEREDDGHRHARFGRPARGRDRAPEGRRRPVDHPLRDDRRLECTADRDPRGQDRPRADPLPERADRNRLGPGHPGAERRQVDRARTSSPA